MNKIIATILILVIGGLAGYSIFNYLNPSFESLSAEEKLERIIE